MSELSIKTLKELIREKRETLEQLEASANDMEARLSTTKQLLNNTKLQIDELTESIEILKGTNVTSKRKSKKT